MPACPICSTGSTVQRDGTPYWMCSGCGVWWQDPMPPKLWHAAHEGDPAQMSDADKAINAQLAEWLFREAMGGSAGYTIDIGAAYPYLAYCLQSHGCNAYAYDGEPIANDLGVKGARFDIEGDDPASHEIIPSVNLITMIHVFEHVYRPLKVFKKLRRMLSVRGALFIRMPDNQVEGIERDLTPGHYQIHPFVHALSSIAELCARTGTFRIERTYELKPGQRDMLLRPL